MKQAEAKVPNLVMSTIQCKCPHCRQGNMFKNNNPYKLNATLEMYDHCTVCGTDFEPEVGFYFGTGYVSYGLCIAFTVATFLFTLFMVGFSIKDNSLFYWLGINVVLIVLLQPIIMRLSRVIWLSFFTKYERKPLV